MTWERALEADARLAAKNAVLIRAALRQSFDAERAYQGYLNTTPNLELNIVQQRVRARSWAIINLRINLEPLKAVVEKLWAEGLAIGYAASGEALIEAQEAKKADTKSIIDWSKWKPGDEAAALVAKKPGLMDILRQAQGFTWKNFSDTTLTDIGNALGEAIALGLDAKASAKLIANHVASPARALTIAITEQNRAVSYATSVRYREAGVQQMQWLVFDPCKICAQNANQIVNIGQQFPSGDQRPPAHPNCRCALAPVIPGFDDQPIPGATVIAPPTPAPVGISAPTPQVVTASTGGFVPGQWRLSTAEERRQEVIDRYTKLNPNAEPGLIASLVDAGRSIPAADIALVKSGIVYNNGPFKVMFYSAGTKVPQKLQQKLLKEIEELQITNPRKEMTIFVASNRGNAYGSALLGDAKIWLRPDTVMSDTPTGREAGHKMPAITTVAQRQYTLAHEWGHTLDEGGSFTRTESIQNATTKRLIEEYKEQFKDKAFMSAYSGENTKEFYAEMFAEFYLTKGTTDNPLVQAMAKEFLWKAPAAPVVNTPAVAVSNYVTAKKTQEYWTANKLLEMYGRNAKGDLDFGSYNRNGQNLFLKNILEEQGYNGLPKVVSATEFQKYIDQGSVPLFRGIAGKTPQEVNEYVTQFVAGESPFIGKGMFGDGTYFGSKKSTGENFAKNDRDGNPIPHGKVVEATLDPRAKVIDLVDLRKIEDTIFPQGHYDYPQDYYEDPGALAASLGYDAVRIKNPKVNFASQDTLDEDYYIILNRTAVIVKEMP
jgi:hypothetical protein